jgi:transposase-like protein
MPNPRQYTSAQNFSVSPGKPTDKQRYRCQNPHCPHPINPSVLDPAYKGRLPDIKQQVIEMSLNASGIRDTTRVLKISTDTAIKELRKKGRRLNP